MHKIDYNPSSKMLRQFGWVGCVICFILSSITYVSTVPNSIFLALSIFFLLASFWPPALRPVFIFISVITWPIGFVVSNLLLGLVYFLLITPIALFFRFRGRDALQRQWKEDESYWEDRPPRRDARSYYRKY